MNKPTICLVRISCICICFSQELAEPSKKLSEETSKSEPAEKDIDDDYFDPSK